MSAFELDHIEDLKPQERRYDLPIEDDFVMSVLPNGIKTWVFVHERDGRPQRRTLGVYPDMSIEMARTSLAAARATRQSLQEAMERSARASAARPEPKRAPRVRRRPLPALALTAALPVAAAGGYAGWRLVHRTAATDGAMTELPAAAREVDTAPAPAPTEAAAPVAAERPALADTPARGDAADSPAVTAERAIVEESPDAVASAQVTADEDVAETVSSPGATLADDDESAQTPAAAVAAPTAATSTAGAAPTPTVTSRAPETTAIPSEASDAEATSLAAFSPETETERTRVPAAEPAITETDTHVARAVLTSNVVKREPVDTIGPQIHGAPGAGTQVYFFTELRGLGGQTLTYRWEREGRLQAEVPLTVGKSWRWRTYSQKDIRADQTGAWRVQLVDASHRVIAEAHFVYRNAATDAQSADAN